LGVAVSATSAVAFFSMKSDAIAFGIAGVVFGLIAGWIIGSQQATISSTATAGTPPAASAPATSAAAPPTRAPSVDETQATALKSAAEKNASDPAPRTQLGNLYFDAERYDDAIKWYAEALKLAPNDVNVSTDLGVCYYYTNQPDKALAQFDKSLAIDSKHAKTLLNVGIVRAFGKQDLDGATKAWQQVIALAPDSPEGKAAKRALDSLQSAHPSVGGTQKPGT
jgi:tetratricopeptide (TPR) repeat protein